MEKAPGSQGSQPAASTPEPVGDLLRQFLQRAERGELTAVVIGFVTKEGAASVQSSPMTAITMNHIQRLLDRKVDRLYDRALAVADMPRSPTGIGVRTQAAQSPAVQLPRKVRRQVQAAQKRVLKKSLKRKGLAGPPLTAES